MRHSLLLALLALFAAACAPELGDACKTATDCSVRGDRVCDTAQPGGYCTIFNCEVGGCGEGGLCVRFRPDEPRLSSTYCMFGCSTTGDCDRAAYVCRSAAEVNTARKAHIAEVLDGDGTAKFCVGKD